MVMQSITSCSLQPAQTRKKAMLASYSDGEFLPSTNGHGLLALDISHVDLNFGSWDRSTSRSSLRSAVGSASCVSWNLCVPASVWPALFPPPPTTLQIGRAHA